MSPAGGATANPERVVLVPAGASIADGFARAREALRNGETVRVLGCGVTYADAWPSWATQARNLSLVELGVYEARSRMEASRSVAASLRDWCDRVFDGLVGDLGGAEVFFGGAAGRLLQDVMDCAALLEGIRMLHADAEVEVVDPSWAGKTLLNRRESWARVALGRLVLPGIVALGVAASALRSLREYELGAPSREKMSASAAQAPTLWLAMIPDWLRANKHLIDTLGAETLARGESLGVLLIQSWGVGTRDEASGAVRGDALWPALGPLLDHFPERLLVVQAVMPDRRAGLVRALLRGALASARATARAMRLGPPPYAASQPIRLATLLSHDVMRATLAADAALRAGAAIPARSRIVFCAANLPVQSAPERVLDRLGIATAEYMHGFGSDAWHGTAESHVGTRFVWTKTDAAGLRPTGQKTVVAGLPAAPPRVGALGHRNILIVTNYFHRDTVVPHGGTKRAPYQRELLTVPERLRAALPDWPLNFRWRPHPTEMPDLVRRAYAELEDVQLSRGRPLEDDLAWADLIVSPHSSVAAQAMFAGLPVFVHLPPEMVDSPFTAYVSESRAFQSTEEAVSRIVPCLRAIARGDQEVLAPEHRAQRTLADGPAPRGLYDAVCQWIAASHVE